MKLTTEELAFFEENGYLEWDGVFSEEELKLIADEFPNTVRENDDRIIYESNGDVRTVFAPDTVNKVYSNFSKIDRIVKPVEQLLGSEVYLHQFKINTKKAFAGDWWEWHQDYPYWHFEDFIPGPNMLSVMLFMQDTTEYSGPLMIIPGSHRDGIVELEHKEKYDLDGEFTYDTREDLLSSLSADLKFTVSKDLLKESIRKQGVKLVTGKKGKLLIFHGNLFHASGVNMNYYDRNMAIMTYNSIDNLPMKSGGRPSYIANPDYRPIEAVTEL